MTNQIGVQPGFHLQLFADETATPSPTPVQAAEQPTEQFAIEQGPSGRRIVRVPEAKPEPQEVPKPEPEKPEKTGEEIPPNEQPPDGPPEEEHHEYTPEEIESAPDIRTLDPKRIPAALQPAYKAMVRGMNAKFQEVAAERKAIQEIAETLQKPQPTQSQKPDPKQYYAQKNAFIRQQIAKTFDVDPLALPDNTSDWPVEMQLAYRDMDDNLRMQERYRQQEEQQQITTVKNIAAIESELRATDIEAYEYAMSKINSGDVLTKDIEAIKAALVKGDRETVQKYFNQYRDEFRGVKKPPEAKKPVPKSPVLETAGKTPAAPAEPQGINLKDFRNASHDDKIKMIAEWRKASQK